MRREEGVSRATSGSQEAKEVANIEDLGAVHTMWKKEMPGMRAGAQPHNHLEDLRNMMIRHIMEVSMITMRLKMIRFLKPIAPMVEQGLDEEDGEAVDWAAMCCKQSPRCTLLDKVPPPQRFWLSSRFFCSWCFGI